MKGVKMSNRGINKVILVGNVGAAPECRTFESGDLVVNFSVATSESWIDKQSGEDRVKTEWHRCVAYRGVAGIIKDYVHKGSKVYLEGKLQTRKWLDKNNQEKQITEIIIEQIELMGGGQSGGVQNVQSSGVETTHDLITDTDSAAPKATAKASGKKKAASTKQKLVDELDDVPF